MNYIIWTAAPEIFTIPGIEREIRWYGLLFAIAFFIGGKLMDYSFKKDGVEAKKGTIGDQVLMYTIIGTVIGARLGHCLFYGPHFDVFDAAGNLLQRGYLSHPLDIIKVWEGGLASHGAAIGMLFASWLFVRKYQLNYLYLIDRIVLTVAIGGALIRFGNFMNSEIIGKPMASGNGVVFIKNSERHFDKSIVENFTYTKTNESTTENGITYPLLKFKLTATKGTSPQELENHYRFIAGRTLFNKNYDPHHRDIHITDNGMAHLSVRSSTGTTIGEFEAYVVTRHPAQLYESISCLILFGILFFIYRKKGTLVPNGLLFGIFVIYIFGLRFVYEFLKENQVAMEDDMTLNMGQKLSIPLVMAGLFLIYNAVSKKQHKVFKDEK